MFRNLPGITEVPNRKKERKLMRSRIRFGTSNPGSCPAGGGGEHAVAGHTFPAGTCAIVTYCSRWPAGGRAGGRTGGRGCCRLSDTSCDGFLMPCFSSSSLVLLLLSFCGSLGFCLVNSSSSLTQCLPAASHGVLLLSGDPTSHR